MHLNRDTAIIRELTELTAAELDIVSGGAGAAASGAGTTSASAAAGVLPTLTVSPPSFVIGGLLAATGQGN